MPKASVAPMPATQSHSPKNAPPQHAGISPVDPAPSPKKILISPKSIVSPKSTRTEEKVFARELVHVQGVSGSYDRQEIPPEPLLVSERFNEINRGHLEAQPASVRRKEHFNLILKSDMRCDSNRFRRNSEHELPPADKYTIDPRGKPWVAYFDQAIAISLIYTAFVTPYEIGFLNHQKQAIDPLFIMGNLINLVYEASLSHCPFILIISLTALSILNRCL